MPNCLTKSRSLAYRPRRAGALTVEFALVLPLVLLFILGLFEYGRYIMTVQLYNNAAREGVRYAITHLQPVTLAGVTYGNSTTDVLNKVNGVLPNITLSGQNTQVFLSNDAGTNLGTWTNAQTGQCVTVRITGNYQVAVMAFLNLPSTIPVTAQATMDVEAN